MELIDLERCLGITREGCEILNKCFVQFGQNEMGKKGIHTMRCPPPIGEMDKNVHFNLQNCELQREKDSLWDKRLIIHLDCVARYLEYANS